MGMRDRSFAENGFWGVAGIATLVGTLWLGDKLDPWETELPAKDKQSEQTPVLSTPEVNNSTSSQDFNIPGLTCTGETITITIDDRALIGSNRSFTKAIVIERPGSLATDLKSETVYALARVVAQKIGRPDLVTEAQLDNFPLGEAPIPTNCTGASETTGLPIQAIN